MPGVKITEVFLSLQGETDRVGLPTVFVRLTGCPLRCVWCDTEYAFRGGQLTSIEDILLEVKKHHTKYVTVTGGEPLAQKHSLVLIEKLCEAGFDVNIETGGMLDISLVDKRACVVLDLKPPSSGEESKNLWENLGHLKAADQVKFVIGSKEDYQWSKAKLDLITKTDKILFSPVADVLDPTDLAQWILEDKLKVRFQLQLHKILWQDAKGK